MSAFFTLSVVIAILVAMACLYAVYLLFRSLSSRDRKVPTVVSLQVAQKYLALIYLIRGSEALIVIPIILGILLIGFSFILAVDRFLLSIVLGSFLAVGVWRIVRDKDRFSKPGREIFRTFQETKEKFLRVTTNSVGNFAFIFAAFAAHDFYRLMPPAPSKIVPGFTGLLNRDLLWVAIFWVLWRFLKISVSRLLELNHPTSLSSDDTDIPEFPRKSPLIPL